MEIPYMKRKFQSGNNYLVLYDCGTAFLRYGDSSPVKCDYFESGNLITIRLEGDTMQMKVEEGSISSVMGDKWEEVYPFEVAHEIDLTETIPKNLADSSPI
jgi:hypothetical protein